jgi:hypothetical protein
VVSVVEFRLVEYTDHPLLERYLPILGLLRLDIECRIECGSVYRYVVDRVPVSGRRFEWTVILDLVHYRIGLSPSVGC